MLLLRTQIEILLCPYLSIFFSRERIFEDLTKMTPEGGYRNCLFRPFLMILMLIPTVNGLSTANLSPRAALLGMRVSQARVVPVIGGAANLWRYHKLLASREANGEATWRRSLAVVRQEWAEYVFQEKAYLYAIQTMRNAITANTFLASTVLSLFSLVVGYVLSQSKYLSESSISLMTMILLQFGPIMVLLLLSAFNFSQSARVMTHTGFLFPVAKPDDSNTSSASRLGASSTTFNRPITTKSVAALMYKSEIQQWTGLRCLYLATAFVTWPLAGSWAFFISTFAFTRFFNSIDRPPPSAGKRLLKYLDDTALISVDT